MSKPSLTLVHTAVATPQDIPLAEKLADHAAILQSYFDTFITRNFSPTARQETERFLRKWFEGIRIPDQEHPDGERQLFVWEAMEPVYGRQYIVEYCMGLVILELQVRTIHAYLGQLQRLFEYVLAYPYIPPNLQSITQKYGRIELPVLKYDYPPHAFDQAPEGFALTQEQLYEFCNFIRTTYIPKNQKKFPALRTYAMIVLAAESGLRADELAHLDALGKNRDLSYEQGLIQTRHGKAAKGSGKRVRQTIFTQFAQETMRVYEARVRPQFPHAKTNPALFLSERGTRPSYSSNWEALHRIVGAAEAEGFSFPPGFSWHDLRRSFATNMLEKFPQEWRAIMRMMGHENPSTLHRYHKPTPEYFDKAFTRVLNALDGDSDA